MKKKITCIVMVGLLSLSALVGCGESAEQPNSEVQKAKTWDHYAPTELVYDCFGGDGEVMPLLGFWSAPAEATYNGQYYPDMKNDDYFAAVKESGINLLIQANDDAIRYYDAVESILSYCDKYDLGYYVTDSNLIAGGSAKVSVSTLETALAEYAARHKSFAGLYLKDEPFVGTEKEMNIGLTTFYEAAQNAGLNVQGYLNLNPYWASMYAPKANENYIASAEAIFQGSGSKMLAYDIYPLKKTGMDYTWYFTNLSLAKHIADSMKIAWTPFVAVCEEGKVCLPDEGELSWQVNEYVAFGAKGIDYFPINSPISFSSEVEQGHTVAMFDYLGNKTEVYYYVKEVNKQLLAVDHYLMKANHHGVIINGELTGKEHLGFGEVIEDGTFRELKKVSGDSVTVGCFDYYGKTCLYVVNNDMYKDASARLDFDARYGYEVIQRGQTANVKGSKIMLDLAAGEAAFIALK